MVDNVKVLSLMAPTTPLVTLTPAGSSITLNWDAILGATSYQIWGSNLWEEGMDNWGYDVDDAYADFPDNWTLITSVETNSYTYPAGTTDLNRYFKVIAVNDSRAIVSPALPALRPRSELRTKQ